MAQTAGSIIIGEDRTHPNLQALDALTLTYPGFERDKREAEAVHLGSSNLSLSFDAAIRRLKVKQRAHEEQKSMRSIHRSHPNLVSLDALKLSYPGWQDDTQKAEAAHNNNPNCDFLEILRKIQVKQLRFENDRTHYRLVEIDNLKLSYPGWKADIRNLEKFHFEEAFFLPGDSLFQSKLDGLKRRQQIYVRSTKLRANRLNHAAAVDRIEEIPTNAPVKKSYAMLIGARGPEKPKPAPTDPLEGDPHESTCCSDSASEDECDEERGDRNASMAPRTPYAVVVDADGCPTHLNDDCHSTTTSALPSLRSDPPNPRPDPPECDKSNMSNKTSSTRSTGRSSVDCDGTGIGTGTGTYGYTRKRVDCDEQVAVRKQPTHYVVQGMKSDPLGSCVDDDDYYRQQAAPLSSTDDQPQTSWPSRLSSYIDLEPIEEPVEPYEEPIQDSEESDEGAHSEDVDQVSALPEPHAMNYSFSKSSSSRRKPSYPRTSVNRPKGIYSAPQLPLDDEERSNVSKALSVTSPSSSRAVYPSDKSSTSTFSLSSTRAVWQDEQSDQSMVSASSSRAVWAESPNPYSVGVQQTPSSIRPVMSMPETPQHVSSSSSRVRGNTRDSVNARQHSHYSYESDQPRIRTEASEQHQHQRSRGTTSDNSRSRGAFNEQGRVRRARRAAEADRTRVSRNSHRSVSSNGTSTSGARTKKLGRCTICGDTDKNHVFVPCGHLCACKHCAGQVISRNMKCPVCRGSVTEAIQVFL